MNQFRAIIGHVTNLKYSEKGSMSSNLRFFCISNITSVVLSFTSGHDKMYFAGHTLVNYSYETIISSLEHCSVDSGCHVRKSS